MNRFVTNMARKLLPENFRNRLQRFSATIAPEEFQRFAHNYAHAPNMEMGLRKLAERGLKPETIVDIGAYHGEWTRVAHGIWPNARKVMIEANREKREVLESVAQEVGAELHFCLLGPEDDREKTFFVMESGSSVLPENSPLDRRSEILKTSRLDTLVGDVPAGLLKLDVQGFELEVLRGAPQALAVAEAVVLEVSLIEINKGAPLMAEVVRFMSDRGFEVCDVLGIHHRPLDKATNQLDLLFVRQDSSILADTRHFG